MLRREPAGQVSRPGLHQHLLPAARRRQSSASMPAEEARHRPQGSHRATAMFSLEEVECIGACSWAPAVQVNYDFHHNVTPEKLDQLLDQLRPGTHPKPSTPISGVVQRTPSGSKFQVLTPPLRRAAIRITLDAYLAARRLQGLAQSAARNDARRDHRRGEELESARPRRRRIPDRA